jgi:hypothetical protein
MVSDNPDFQIALKALSDRLSKVETPGNASASVAGTSSWPTLDDEPSTKSSDLPTSVHRSTTPGSIDETKDVLIDIDAPASKVATSKN